MPFLSKRIAVFLSARNLGAKEENLIKLTAEYLASENYKVFYGGGYSGMMGVFSKAYEAISPTGIQGVSTLHLKDTEAQNYNPGNTIFVESMSTRKEMQLHQVNKVLILPGGFGTMDELFEALVLNQLGIIKNKICILDPDLKPALELMLKVMVKRGTISEQEANKITFFDTLADLQREFTIY